MAQKVKVHGKYSDMQGLKIVGGMMVNEKPDSMAFVTQAAIMRKDRMRQEKIQMMEDAYVRAEMKSDIMEKLMNGESEK